MDQGSDYFDTRIGTSVSVSKVRVVPPNRSSLQRERAPFSSAGRASMKPGRKKSVERRLELIRLLDMRDMAGACDLNELAVGEVLGGLAAKFRPVAEWLDRLGRSVAAEENAAVALADDEQHRHFEERIFLPVRLLKHHLVDERRGPRPAWIFGTDQHARENIDIVLCNTRPSDEEGGHESAVAFRRLLHFGLEQRLDWLGRDGASVVFQADGVFQRQNRRRLGIVARKINREHAAERITDNRGARHAEAVEQGFRTAGEKIEAVAECPAWRICRSQAGPARRRDIPRPKVLRLCAPNSRRQSSCRGAARRSCHWQLQPERRPYTPCARIAPRS